MQSQSLTIFRNKSTKSSNIDERLKYTKYQTYTINTYLYVNVVFFFLNNVPQSNIYLFFIKFLTSIGPISNMMLLIASYGVILDTILFATSI